jgi:DNA-binding transcriptional ArsR family regulator
MLDDAARLLALLKALPAALVALLTRGPGRPPIPDEPEAVLLHPRRRAIYRLVGREPGLSVGDVQRRLKILSGAFHNHMERLVAAGLVERRDTGTNTRLYLTDAAPPPDAPTLGNDTAKAIARVVLEKPGLDSEQIGEEAGKSQRTAQVYLRTLREAGYVELSPGEGPPLYYPTAKLRKDLTE